MPRPYSCAMTIFFLVAASVAPAAAQLKVRVNWSAIAAGQSRIWISHDEGLFKKYSLDVELLHIPSSSLIIQTILAGEIAISYVHGRNTMQFNLTGSDMVLIAGVKNRFPFTFMARPEFKRATDLRGKRIGITSVGSSTHTVTLYVLNQAGLKPGDYEIVSLGEVPTSWSPLPPAASTPAHGRRKQHPPPQRRHGRTDKSSK